MSYLRAAVIVILVAGLTGCDSSGTNDALEETASELQAGINVIFNDIDSTLQRATATLGEIGLDNAGAREVIGSACLGKPYAIDCSGVNANGIMTIVEPEEYREYEGSDISGQTAEQRLLNTQQPVFSSEFETVEGIVAATMDYPFFSASGELGGSLSFLFSPVLLCDGVIAPALVGTDFNAWVMQLDGLIVYETDPTQIGLNLFTDPLYQGYPELIALGQRIAAEPEGEGYYTFPTQGSEQVVRKRAVWRTVSQYDNEWRVVVYREEQ